MDNIVSTGILKPKYAIPLVGQFRSPHHSCRESEMRTSEPKPHWINKVASVLRFRSSQTRVPQNNANFGIGTLAAAQDLRGLRMAEISRRDFLNGTALAITAGLTPAIQVAAQPSRYPPASTGLRGQHVGAFESAHALVRMP